VARDEWPDAVGEPIDPGPDTRPDSLPFVLPSFLDDTREDLRAFWLKQYRAGRVDPVTLDVVKPPTPAVSVAGNRAARRAADKAARKADKRVRARA